MSACIKSLFYKEIVSPEKNNFSLSAHGKVFYKDLYNRYGESYLNINNVYRSYDQETLIKYLHTDQQTNDNCKKADYILLTQWIPEFDPDYASFNTQIIKLFGWSEKLLDIGNAGRLVQFTALHLALDCLESCASAVVITAESALQYKMAEKPMRMPEINFVSSFCLSISNNPKSIEVVDVLFNTCFKKMIDILLEKLKLSACHDRTDCLIYMRKSKAFSIKDNDPIVNDKNFTIKKLDYPFSSGFLTHCMNRILMLNKMERPAFFIVTDHESDRYAAALIRTGE